MLHPLSLITYFRRNPVKIGIVVSILALSILAVISIGALTGSFKKDAMRNAPFYSFYNYLSVTASPDRLPQLEAAAREKLENIPGVESILVGDLSFIRKEALIGNLQTPLVFLSPDDIRTVMSATGTELADGLLPRENTNDLAFTKSLRENRHKDLGDTVGDTVDEFEFLQGEWQLSGSVTDGSNELEFLAFGDLTYSNQTNGRAATTFFLRPSVGADRQAIDTALQRIKSELKREFSEARVSFETEGSFERFIDNNFRFMDIMVWSIMLIITLVMTTSVALFNIIIFMQRSSEFGLLLAMGYTRGAIIRKTLLESVTQIILATAFGLLLTWVLASILNAAVFVPRGFAPLPIWEARSLLFALPIPISVAIFSVLTILSQILRFDPIAILERRD